MGITVQVANAPLLVSSHLDVTGPVLNDTVVQKQGSLHVHGNLIGSLTIEMGASVIVEGYVDGKIINRGGRLVVNNNVLVDLTKIGGPPEAESGGVLKINLSAIALNWSALARRTVAECAAVIRADAYGCGIDIVASALTRSGCKTFFVSNLAEAKCVRAAAPNSAIYVLNGLYPGTGSAFAEINAQPVVCSLVEMAEWDGFLSSSGWAGGFALEVNTSKNRLGISVEEAAALLTKFSSAGSGITLLMSHLDHARVPDHPSNYRQIKLFQDLRRIYRNVPASLANSAGIFVGPEAHFDLVRPGSALYGINPTPGKSNPMQPVIELRARIVHVGDLLPGDTLALDAGWAATRQTRISIVSLGCADGYARSDNASRHPLQAIVGGNLCPLVGRISMDRLAIDVTGLPDPRLARRGDMVTLIGGPISVDDVAAAAQTTGYDVLANLRRRVHCVHYCA
jgi:alanine racemase